MAATFGDVDAWARAMRKLRRPIPAWFTPGPRHADDGGAAFLAMVSWNGSSGGDGGASAGASSGGGGSGAA